MAITLKKNVYERQVTTLNNFFKTLVHYSDNVFISLHINNMIYD